MSRHFSLSKVAYGAVAIALLTAPAALAAPGASYTRRRKGVKSVLRS